MQCKRQKRGTNPPHVVASWVRLGDPVFQPIWFHDFFFPQPAILLKWVLRILHEFSFIRLCLNHKESFTNFSFFNCVLGRVNISGVWRPYEWFFMIMMTNDIQGWLGPKFCRHLSYSWGKTPENLNQENWPDRGSNPDPLGKKTNLRFYVIFPVLLQYLDLNY